MKTKLIQPLLIVALLSFSSIAFSQEINTPWPSPTCKVEQSFGLSTVTIDYSRPGVKGRKIFGGLVPYGKIWRTGANFSTKIKFSKDVKLEGNDVKAGEYALYTIPGETEWTVMLYNDLTLGGNVANYKTENELLRFTVPAIKMSETVESFTINLDDLRDDSATLYIIWESTYVPMKLTIDTQTEVIAQIERFANNPEASLGGAYYQAASYYESIDKDLEKALVWITKATEINPNAFWMTRRKSLIEAKLGKYKEAIKSAELSLKVAKERNNEDYVRMNTASIEEWKKK